MNLWDANQMLLLGLFGIFALYLIVTGITGTGPTQEDFNFSESKAAVEQAMPGGCHSTRNLSLPHKHVYHFECRSSNGNYTYIGRAEVHYNESGSDRVVVFD